MVYPTTLLSPVPYSEATSLPPQTEHISQPNPITPIATTALTQEHHVPKKRKQASTRFSPRKRAKVISPIADQNAHSQGVAPKKQENLDYTQRPVELKKEIDRIFEVISQNTYSWRCHGIPKYEACGASEYHLLRILIQEAPPSQKDFYIIDVGAGDFSWSKSIAKSFATKEFHRPDFTLHIISAGGETGRKIPEEEQIGRCKIYNFQGFKIEEIFKELEKKGLHLQNQVDLAISRMCLIHLADPVGTVPQIFNLLRPKTGCFICDGFFFALEGQEAFEQKMGPSRQANANLIQLLLDMKAPFLVRHGCAESGCDEYIVQRPDEGFCCLPMSYSGIRKTPVLKHTENASGIVCEFQRQPQSEDLPFLLPPDHTYLSGNKQLFDWLKKNEILRPDWLEWKPVLVRDLSDTDINKRDTWAGRTPLHHSIIGLQEDTFQEILKRRADVHLCSKDGFCPLHYAAEFDTKGVFISKLIQAGSDINQKIVPEKCSNEETPLDREVKSKDLFFAQIFIDAGQQIRTVTAEELKTFAEPLVREGKISSSQLDHAMKYENQTPLDRAVKSKNLKGTELLIQSGARIFTVTAEKIKTFADPLVHEGKISPSQLEHAMTGLMYTHLSSRIAFTFANILTFARSCIANITIWAGRAACKISGVGVS